MASFVGFVVLLATAHGLGWLAERVKQQPLLGHMLAGVLWGPFVLDGVRADPALQSMSDASVMAVVVAAGLEMRLRDVAATFRGAGVIALLPAFLLPAIAGGLFAYADGDALRAAIVVGLCTSVTALPVALRILDRAGMLQTRVAAVAISGALAGDLIVLAGLAMAGAGGRVSIPYAVVVFILSLLVSDVVDTSETGRRIRRLVATITTAVFAPFFLAYQGVQIAPAGLPSAGYVGGLIVVAMITKMAGGYLTGLASGLSRRDARGVAVVMNARGLMEMVIANIAFRAGLVSAPVFSALLIMGTVTTLFTPPLLSRWQRRGDVPD